MKAIVDYFLRRHFLVNVMVAAVVVLGVWTATSAQREGFPTIALNQLVVTAKLPGASAAEVERELTVPIEEAVAELDGVDSYHTVITDNLSVTTIEYADRWGPPRMRVAEADLRQAVDAITGFPARMDDEPVISRVEPAKMPVVEIALAGPSSELPAAAEAIEAALTEVDGISKIELVGLEDRELRVLVDPLRARAHAVGFDEITRAIQDRNVASTGGVLEADADRRQVVLESRFASPEEVGETVVAVGAGGEIVRVEDLARLELGRRDEGLRVHTNGQPGISVVVRKRDEADILATVDDVAAAVATLELPEGVDYTLVNDASFTTRNRLRVMTSNGLVGMVLVILVLGLFLDLRATVWVALGVPVVLLGVLALLPVLGMTLNMITLGGFVVVLGMLVDDAVVVAERIVLRQGQGLGRGPRAAIAGVSDVIKPVSASAITTVLAFSPMFAIGGMPGKFAWALPTVVILALALSLIESFLILPAHMSRSEDDPPASEGDAGDDEANGARPKASRPQPAPGDSPASGPQKRGFVLALERIYAKLLDRALRLRWLVLAGFIAAFVVVMAGVAPRLGFDLFPQDDSEALYIELVMPVGTPIEQTEAAVSAVERQLPTLVGEDLTAVTARIGHRDAQALDRTTGAAEHEAVISVLFRPLDRERTSAEWAERLDDTLVVPEGASLRFEAKRIGPPIGAPVALHISANDDGLRRSTAAAAADWLAEVPGVVDVAVDERPGIPQVELALDHDKAALRGLDAASVGRTLTTAFHGLPISEHRSIDETTEFRLILEPAARGDLDALLELPLRSASGELVLLRDLVQPVEVQAVSRLHHREGRRTATVTASFAPDSGLDASAMAERLEAELIPGLRAELGDDQLEGLGVEIGGEASETEKTTGDMRVAMLIAVAAIVTVIALIVGSFFEALFIVAVIPFGAAGVMLAFFIHGRSLSMFAMLGIIGLSGVVVNAAIVMVDAIRTRVVAAASEPDITPAQALRQAVIERLRPILVTTLTTCGGVLPTAYGLGGYDAVLSPMSLALGWGLLFATTITLFLVPCLYAIAQDIRGLVARGRGRLRVRTGDGDQGAR